MTRESRYGKRLLMDEFKREMNSEIRIKLIKAECPPKSIRQWYERVANLNRYWKESKRKREIKG